MSSRSVVLSFRRLSRACYRAAVLLTALALAACDRQAPPLAVTAQGRVSALARVESRPLRWRVRATGTIQPVQAVTLSTPQLRNGGDLVLTRIAPSGTRVREGDIIAEFDRTRSLDRARDAQARYEDLQHQVEQRKAQQHSDQEKRVSDLQQAEADLAKARLELRKGPLLSEIDHLKAESKLDVATAHVASLTKSDRAHRVAEVADLKILELQRDRQKTALERAQENAERLQIRSPLAGMVVQDVIWRSGQNQPGHPQEGDQLWAGQPLVKVFASTAMEVLVSVAEPDGSLLAPGTRAEVRLDAYPEVAFPAHFDTASPVASGGNRSAKTFAARFRLESDDRRLLPDLSAAVDVELSTAGPVVAVPRAVVRYRQGRPYVILAGRERDIELGRAFDDSYLEVASGLAAGDEVSR